MSNPAPPSADDLERLAKQWFCAGPALSAAQLSEIAAWQKRRAAPPFGSTDAPVTKAC